MQLSQTTWARVLVALMFGGTVLTFGVLKWNWNVPYRLEALLSDGVGTPRFVRVNRTTGPVMGAVNRIIGPVMGAVDRITWEVMGAVGRITKEVIMSCRSVIMSCKPYRLEKRANLGVGTPKLVRVNRITGQETVQMRHPLYLSSIYGRGISGRPARDEE